MMRTHSMNATNPFPKARSEDIVSQQAGDELLVFDKKFHHAHCLNKLAGLVWRHCDGQRSVADLAGIVHEQAEDSCRCAVDRAGPGRAGPSAIAGRICACEPRSQAIQPARPGPASGRALPPPCCCRRWLSRWPRPVWKIPARRAGIRQRPRMRVFFAHYIRSLIE